jgi:hypothetical protein
MNACFSSTPEYGRQTFRCGWVLLSFVLLMMSCEKREKQKALFFPLDSLIEHQVVHLRTTKASLKKTARLGSKTDEKIFEPQKHATDTVPWLHELAVFRELDIINKPINEDAYKIDNGLTDVRSNLKLKVFTAKHPDSTRSGEILPVRYLRIYYHNTVENIRRIEAEMDVSTSLYGSARHLQMEFQDINDAVVLTSYSVSGGQKMYLGDSVQYKVQGSITLPNQDY